MVAMFSLFKHTKTFKFALAQPVFLKGHACFLFSVLLLSALLLSSLMHSPPAVADPRINTKKGALGNNRMLEPRLQRQVEEEKRKERERKRKAFEAEEAKRKEARKRYYYGEKEKEKSAEQIQYEENKEYMNAWERLKFSWRNSENIQDIFDISLNSTYAPARVKSSFISVHSGPGRHYPVIYIAAKGEQIDFTAIRTEWYQLRTADGHFGWAHISSLPEALEFDYNIQGFADEAKAIATRKLPLDLGFSGGLLDDDPMFSASAKVQNTHFISTEFEFGASRGTQVSNDYFGFNALIHPFSELKYRPHFILGLGQMRTEYSVGATTDSDSGLYTKAGIGFVRKLDQRMRLRAEVAQYSVENPLEELNHYSQIMVGASYVVAGNTDEILNRRIGERVSPSDTELGLFTGAYHLSHGPTVSNTGLRLSYHVSEDYFMEFHASQGNHEFQSIGFAVARNFLPAEYVIKWRGKKNYWPTRLYGLLGTGLQHIDDDEQIAVSLGGGLSINPLRRIGIRLDARQHIVHQQFVNGVSFDKYLKNPELSFGFSYYF